MVTMLPANVDAVSTLGYSSGHHPVHKNMCEKNPNSVDAEAENECNYRMYSVTTSVLL